jgi:hypothetical protein
MKLVLLALLATSACVIDEADLGQVDQDVTTTNRLATNRLATNKLATNKLATNKLAAASFASGSPAQPLLSTADGRDVMTYMLQCALTPAQSITLKDSSGVSWTFTGLLGVAPAWTTRALTVDEQRWVTGCLLARVNYFGVVVNLSMRATLPALGTTPDAGYPKLDGRFYGNLFDPTGPKEYACDGRFDNAQRICADVSADGVTTNCGFTYTGSCAPAPQLNDVGACNANVTLCRTTRSGSLGLDAYSQIVSVYLQN